MCRLLTQAIRTSCAKGSLCVRGRRYHASVDVVLWLGQSAYVGVSCVFYSGMVSYCALRLIFPRCSAHRQVPGFSSNTHIPYLATSASVQCIHHCRTVSQVPRFVRSSGIVVGSVPLSFTSTDDLIPPPSKQTKCRGSLGGNALNTLPVGTFEGNASLEISVGPPLSLTPVCFSLKVPVCFLFLEPRENFLPSVTGTGTWLGHANEGGEGYLMTY